MSKPRYRWWGYICGIMYDYRGKKAKIEDALSLRVTASLSGQPHASGVHSPVEDAVIRAVSADDYREVEAVDRAIEATLRCTYGKQRVELVRMVYWDKTHTIVGAGMVVGCEGKLARRWSADFKYYVAHYMGFEIPPERRPKSRP